MSVARSNGKPDKPVLRIRGGGQALRDMLFRIGLGGERGGPGDEAGRIMAAAGNSEGLLAALRKRGISDARVLGAVASVPREAFVASTQAGRAYADEALPIDCGQTISQPFIVAYMTQQLELEPQHDVLEIGTGSGYQAAILSRLCRHVHTIERHEFLRREAMKRLQRLGIGNVTALLGDGWSGWPEPREFDRIIVTAAARETPRLLVEQLKIGGRMIAPIGSRLMRQRLVLIQKTETGVTKKDLLRVRFVPLVRGRG